MGRKAILEKRMARLEAKKNGLVERAKASQNADEVRSINEQIAELNEEITECRDEIATLETEVRDIEPTPADQVERRGGEPMMSYMTSAPAARSEEDKEMEYRQAFMEYVLRGTAIPKELRANANTLTTDVGAAIPTHLVNKIIEAFDNVGMILPVITKTAYAAGISIPVSSVKPVATWVAEGATSDKQKKSVTNITFTYHKLRCEVSMSMEVGTMAISAFEAKFVENVAKAMVYAIENAIINGTGSGQPKGILKETPVSGQALSKALSYAALCDVEAAIPSNYETSAKLCMNKKTFWAIQALADGDGHPIARVNYGIGGKPERFILGREVIVAPYVADNKVIAFDFADYVLNTIYDMGITKKQDWDTEDLLTKAVMSVDGKVVDKASLVTLTVTTS